ncbi:MAG: death on curing protein [Candidatus Eremiobacteraeota bacterium]|nr:death on curing protein [Candidatus Eremiobacteraeota bacterium]
MVWIRIDTVLAIHEAQIDEHGGGLGVRDLGLLESALARPRNVEAYAERDDDVPLLAALHAIALVRNHPFVDGNKRVGLVLLDLFLDLNGYELSASDADCAAVMWCLASGATKDDDFIAWVRDHAQANPKIA